MLLTAALAAFAGAFGMAGTSGAAHAQTTVAPPPPPPPTVTTSWSGAPRTREEDREFKVNGRIQYDIFNVSVDDGNPATNDVDYSGSDARRAFIGVEGRFTQNWRYNIKFDLSPGASNNQDEVRLDDAFLEYAGDDFSFIIGQNNAVAHMEDRTSSNYTPFNERSMIDQAFGFGKIFGVGFVTNGGNWSAGVEYYLDSLNNQQVEDRDEQQALYGRFTFAPYYERTPDGVNFIHLGVNARHREGGSGVPSGSGFLSYSARPNQGSISGLSSTISSSGNWGSDNLYGVELAAQHNAFGATAEYMQLDATRSGANPAGLGSDAQATGGYVDLFWSPTGEGRNYQAVDGSWGRVTPRRTLGSDGGIGHVMLGARYEWLDLGDQNFASSSAVANNRGEQTGWLAQVTWQPIAYVKFQLDYGQYTWDRPGTVNDRDYDTMSLRTQIDW